MSHTTKNYSDGGNRTVIGGVLEIVDGGVFEVKDGARVIGLNGVNGSATLPFLSNSTATTIAALREDYNSLLAVLQYAGFMDKEAKT